MPSKNPYGISLFPVWYNDQVIRWGRCYNLILNLGYSINKGFMRFEFSFHYCLVPLQAHIKHPNKSVPLIFLHTIFIFSLKIYLWPVRSPNEFVLKSVTLSNDHTSFFAVSTDQMHVADFQFQHLVYESSPALTNKYSVWLSVCKARTGFEWPVSVFMHIPVGISHILIVES